MRLGGNITGRVLISNRKFRQLATVIKIGGIKMMATLVLNLKQNGGTVKTVIQVRDQNTEGHPLIHVEVVLDLNRSCGRYNPPNLWDNIGLGGVMFGVVPPVFGWVAGGLGGLNPGDPGFGGSGGAANAETLEQIYHLEDFWRKS